MEEELPVETEAVSEEPVQEAKDLSPEEVTVVEEAVAEAAEEVLPEADLA